MKRHEGLGRRTWVFTHLAVQTDSTQSPACPHGFSLSNLLLPVALHPFLVPQVAFSPESLPLVPFPQILPASALSHTSSPILGLEKVSLHHCCPLSRGHFQHGPASFFPKHFSSCVIDSTPIYPMQTLQSGPHPGSLRRPASGTGIKISRF